MLQRWLQPLLGSTPQSQLPKTQSGVQAVPYSGFDETGGLPNPTPLSTRVPARTPSGAYRPWDHRTDGNTVVETWRKREEHLHTGRPPQKVGIQPWLLNPWTGSAFQIGGDDPIPFHRNDGATIYDKGRKGVKTGATSHNNFQYTTMPYYSEEEVLNDQSSTPQYALQKPNSPTGWVRVFLDSTDSEVAEVTNASGFPLSGYELNK